jgi:hypothetical protein
VKTALPFRSPFSGVISAVRCRRPELVGGDPGLRQWSYIRKMVDTATSGKEHLKVLRVALLSSFSIEFIHDVLAVQAL